MKRIAAALLTVFASARVQAADNAATVEVLKERVLQHVIVADAARNDPACIGLWFGGVDDARKLHLSLNVDGAAALEHGFDTTEAQALANGGLFHVDCLRLAPGTHQLQAVLSWNVEGDKPPPRPLVLEQEVSPPQPGTLLQLRLRAGLIGPALELRASHGEPYRASDWRTRLGIAVPEESGDQFALGGAADPRVRQARLLLDTGHALSATALLRELAATTPEATLAPRFPLELAQAESAYGLPAAAEAHWRAAPEVPANNVQRAALSLKLAQYRYQRGEQAAAQELLGAPPTPHRAHPDAASIARQRLYALLLLAQGRYEQAAEILRDTFNTADYESWVSYYNLGVALTQSGQAPQGLTVLNRVGSLAGDVSLLRCLRDHANLVLARHFLEAGQGATAIPLFGRIDSAGPDSAAALLGLGWAWLVPPGTTQAEIPLGDEIVTGAPPETLNGAVKDLNDQNLYLRFHLAPFAQAGRPGDEAARLRRALAAWVLVADHSEREAQEADIDIAWALRRLGVTRQAAQYDEQAVASLEKERAQLAVAETQAHDAHSPDRWLAGDRATEPGLPWEMPALPPPPSGLLLLDLVASHLFQNALHDERDLLLLEKSLDGAADASLHTDLEQARLSQRVLLQTIQLDALAVERRRTEALLVYARDALSAVYDQPDAKPGS